MARRAHGISIHDAIHCGMVPPRVARTLLVLVALAGQLHGCGRSALIRADDVTYRRAIEHFKRPRQLVAATLASEDEQAIFLQAEGMFRYRFGPAGRSIGSY